MTPRVQKKNQKHVELQKTMMPRPLADVLGVYPVGETSWWKGVAEGRYRNPSNYLHASMPGALARFANYSRR